MHRICRVFTDVYMKCWLFTSWFGWPRIGQQYKQGQQKHARTSVTVHATAVAVAVNQARFSAHVAHGHDKWLPKCCQSQVDGQDNLCTKGCKPSAYPRLERELSEAIELCWLQAPKKTGALIHWNDGQNLVVSECGHGPVMSESKPQNH